MVGNNRQYIETANNNSWCGEEEQDDEQEAVDEKRPQIPKSRWNRQILPGNHLKTVTKLSF